MISSNWIWIYTDLVLHLKRTTGTRGTASSIFLFKMFVCFMHTCATEPMKDADIHSQNISTELKYQRPKNARLTEYSNTSGRNESQKNKTKEQLMEMCLMHRLIHLYSDLCSHLFFFVACSRSNVSAGPVCALNPNRICNISDAAHGLELHLSFSASYELQQTKKLNWITNVDAEFFGCISSKMDSLMRCNGFLLLPRRVICEMLTSLRLME